MHQDTPHPADPRITTVLSYRPLNQLIPAHWQTGDLVANGISQRYYRSGGALPPLLLLHGFMEGALSWLATAQALQSDYDVLMLDTRGHGRSARIGGNYTTATLVDDVVAALAQLGLSRINLLGFSQGATTAVLLAAQHPQLVHSLILAGMAEAAPNPAEMQHSPGYQAWLNNYRAWLHALREQNHEQRLRSGLSQFPAFAPPLPELDYVAWIEQSANLDLELLDLGSQLWEQVAEAVDLSQQALLQLQCPTLILKSGSAPVSSGPLELREAPGPQPNLQIIHFENTGHLIYRDRFEAFVEQTRRFLAAHNRREDWPLD